MSDAKSSISLDVPCDTHAPKAVRDALRAAHDGGWSLADGLLIASELVTNAVIHSGGTGADRIHVTVQQSADCLHICVHDPGRSGQRAQPEHSERAGAGGWGLALIEQLCLRWGSDRPDGYRVWADLSVDGSRPGSGRAD